MRVIFPESLESPAISAATPRQKSRFCGPISHVSQLVSDLNALTMEHCSRSASDPSRTVFLYPLSPFFVLFCNIIGEIDIDDYHLIQDITKNLSQFSASPYITKLLRLLGTLQNLCEPLIHTKQNLGAKAKVASWYPVTSDEPQEFGAVSDGSLALEAPYPNTTQPYSQFEQPGVSSVPPMADEMMWHLFNSQPSLQWFESDIISLARW